MGKRSNFERRKSDNYPTPPEAVLPLLSHIRPGSSFHEPCVGEGQLVATLLEHGFICCGRSDCFQGVMYDSDWDASKRQYSSDVADFFITNPPWTREVLHPIIENLSKQKPTWLLLDTGWMFTKQAKPYLTDCRKIVTVGRLKWIPDSKMTGKDDCAWFLFDRVSVDYPKQTIFCGK